MTNNLPADLNDDWIVSDTVMPVHVNSWASAINKIKEAVPIYSANGNFYTATYADNVYSLAPIEMNSESNATPASYIDGMKVVFKCPLSNLENCAINVNNLGIKEIKNIQGSSIIKETFITDTYIELRYNSSSDCFIYTTYSKPTLQQNYLYSYNSGNVTSGNADLIDATLSQDTEYSEAGTYTFEVQTAGYYSIALVGGGGSGVSGLNSLGYGSYCGGGSGAAFVGEVYLNVGNHNITVGGQAGDSILYDENGNALITAGAGTNGAMTDYNLNRAGGYGGTLTIASGVQTQNVTVQSNGNDGGFSNANVPQGGGASVYNGYGKGSDSLASNFTIGYFSIELGSGNTNVSYKVGGSYPALTGTLANGEQFTLNGLNSDDITGLADGSYIKYVGSDGSSELLKANLTVAKTVPTTPANNDVWINNSVSPLTIKKYVEQNYTVVGSPTITADGVVSGFSSSNYITVPTLNLSNPHELYVGIIPESGLTTGTSGILAGTYNGNANVYIDYYSQLIVPKWVTSDGTTVVAGWNDNTIRNGQPRIYKFVYNGSMLSCYRIDSSGTTLLGQETTTMGLEMNQPYAFGSVYGSNYFVGSIDLKEFKVYVNDNLFYQPSIPNGWIDYNKVPLGKITLSSGGITAVKTFPYNIDYISNNIVETYQNGSDWYRVYADGWCEQGGTIAATGTTQEVSAALLKNYADTNYNIQLSYAGNNGGGVADVGTINESNKTTSGFKVYQYYDITLYWQTCGYINNA